MKVVLTLTLVLVLFGCNTPKVEPEDILVEKYLESEESKKEFKALLIRDIGKLPKKANHKTKGDSKFDDHYQDLIHQHHLMFYYPSKNSDTIYFAINRITPSLYGKKVAIGGKVLIGQNNQIDFLEETFRTFKMPLDELQEKTQMLFLKMIDGDDLSQYEYKNSQPEEYIEFPDQYTFYNSIERKWETTREMYYGS